MKAKAKAKQRQAQLRLPTTNGHKRRDNNSHENGAGGGEAAAAAAAAAADGRNVCSSSGSEQEKSGEITKNEGIGNEGPYPIGATITIDIATGTACSIGDTTTSARTTTTSTTGAAAATGVDASADRSRDGDGGAGGGEDVRGTTREGTNEEEDRHRISNGASGLVEGQVRSETRRLRSDLSEARSTISDLRAELQTLQDTSQNTIEAMASSHRAQLATMRSQIATVLAQATAASVVASAVPKRTDCACLEATIPRIERLVSQLRSMVEKQQDEEQQEQQEHQRSTPSPLPPSQSDYAEGQLDGQDNGEKGGTDDGGSNIDEPTVLQRSRSKPSAGAAPLVTPPPRKRRNKLSRDSTGTMGATRAIGHDDRGRVGPWGPPTGEAHGGKRRKLSSSNNNAREVEYVRTVTATAGSGGAVGCHRSLVEKAFDSARFPGNGGGIKRRGDLNKVYLIDPIDDDGDGDQMEQGTEMIPETPAVPPSSRPRTVATSTVAGGPSRTNGTVGTNQAASADQSRTNAGKGESHATNDADAAADQAAAGQSRTNAGKDKSDATTGADATTDAATDRAAAAAPSRTNAGKDKSDATIDADTADQAATDQAAAAAPSRTNAGKDKSDATTDADTDAEANTDADTDTQSIPYTRISRKGETGRWPSERSEEPSYKYHEVVRNKEKRRAMKGYECEQCREFYDAIKKGDHKGEFNRQEMVCKHSRHRSNHTPELTPKGFWNIDFVDSPGYEHH